MYLRRNRHHEVLERSHITDRNHTVSGSQEVGFRLYEDRRQVELVGWTGGNRPVERDAAFTYVDLAFTPMQKIAVAKVAAELAGEPALGRQRLEAQLA